MKDLEYRGDILSGTLYRASPEGLSLMDETNKAVSTIARRGIAVAMGEPEKGKGPLVLFPANGLAAVSKPYPMNSALFF